MAQFTRIFHTRVWDYEFLSNRRKGVDFTSSGFTVGSQTVVSQGQRGFEQTTVYEPELDKGTNNPTRVYTVYNHHVDSINGWHLFGKLYNIRQFDDKNYLLNEKEVEYQANKAFMPGMERGEYIGLGYEDIINNAFSFVGNRGLGIPGAGFAEELNKSDFDIFHNQYLNSFFVKKNKESSTDYEYIVSYDHPTVAIDTGLINFGEITEFELNVYDDVVRDTVEVFVNIGNFGEYIGNWINAGYYDFDEDTIVFSHYVEPSEENEDGKIITKGYFPDGEADVEFNNVFPGLKTAKQNDLVTNYTETVAEAEATLAVLKAGFGLVSTSTDTLKITITDEYEYFDANEEGKTNSEGFEVVLSQSANPTIQLLHEPSWQLYAKKTYSPELPDAYGEQDYFYFYDLANVLVYPNIIDNNNVIHYLHKYKIRDIVYESGITNKTIGKNPVRIAKYYEYKDNWDNIDFFGPNVTENIGPNTLDLCSFGLDLGYIGSEYDCDSSLFTTVVDSSLIDSSFAESPLDTLPNVLPAQQESGCIYVKWPYSNEPPPAPTGYYLHYDGVYYWYCPDTLTSVFPPLNSSPPSTTISTNVLNNLSYTLDIGYFIPDPPEIDTTGVVNSYFLDTLSVSLSSLTPTLDSFGLKALPYNTLFQQGKVYLSSVHQQIDTLRRLEYDYEMTFYKKSILKWKPVSNPVHGGGVLSIKPYWTSQQFEIIERNQYMQPQLVKNAKGLITKYDYFLPYSVFYIDTVYNIPLMMASTNKAIGMPIRITEGYGLNNALITEYDYDKNTQVSNIVDPNGMEASYSYDGFNRLHTSFLNDRKLDLNLYNYWNGDTTLSFNDRAKQNYVENHLYTNLNEDTTGIKTRTYIDPNSREWGVVSQNFQSSPYEWHDKVIHKGQEVLDEWNRPVKSYKPFEAIILDSLEREFPKLNTSIASAPLEQIQTKYEKNQRSRPVVKSDYGVPLSSSRNVQNAYELINGEQVALELNLSATEEDRVMGGNIWDNVFRRTSLKDQDGKITIEYSNALGQKVGIKQLMESNQMAVTLFVYDDKGNVGTVINPKKQYSTYEYNLTGNLFRKNTIDGGTTKYMYDRLGNLILEQDENLNDKTSWRNNEYRRYSYDSFGRLVKQERIKIAKDLGGNMIDTEGSSYSNFYNYIGEVANNYSWQPYSQTDSLVFTPMYYSNYLSNASLIPIPFSYRNTYGDAFIYTSVMASANQLGLYVQDVRMPNAFASLNIHSENWIEKELAYDSLEIDQTMHTNALPYLHNSIENSKGKPVQTIAYNNYGDPVQYSFFSYNNDGNLKWEMKQFNKNGIQRNEHGLVYRIDYKDYSWQGNLLTQNVDINSDFSLDAQYHYSFDEFNRLKEVYFNLDSIKENGNLLASYEYDNALGRLLHTKYYATDGSTDIEADDIELFYDARNRLTKMKSTFFDYDLYYDTNKPTGISAHNNYNGNINATKATYLLSGFTSHNGLFNTPTTYGYQYDKLNRLTNADALTYGSNTNTGDVSYSYDKVGNLLSLNRYLSGNTNSENFTYAYALSNNQLTRVISSLNSNRRYTYDEVGNLLTDSYKGLSQTEYGRANLPFYLDLDNGDETNYLYDEGDNRMYKSSKDTFNLVEQEYYLKNSSGQSFATYDYNTGKFVWYAFGGNRFARIEPNINQQAVVDFGGDPINPKSVYIGNLDDESQALVDALVDFKTNNYSFSDYLKLVDYNNDTRELIFDDYLTYKLQQNTGLTAQTLNEIFVGSNKQIIHIEKKDKTLFGGLDNDLKFGNNGILTMGIGELFTGIGLDTISTPIGGSVDSFYFNGDPFDSAYTTMTNTILEPIIFYIYDHLGNTRVTYSTHNDHGTPVYNLEGAFDYYPYGKLLRSFNSPDEKYLSTFHERDEETGFDYRGARFYDSDVARFLSLDPQAVDYPSLSDYVYVANMPVVFIDPNGKKIDVSYIYSTDIGKDILNTVINDLEKLVGYKIEIRYEENIGYSLREGDCIGNGEAKSSLAAAYVSHLLNDQNETIQLFDNQAHEKGFDDKGQPIREKGNHAYFDNRIYLDMDQYNVLKDALSSASLNSETMSLGLIFLHESLHTEFGARFFRNDGKNFIDNVSSSTKTGETVDKINEIRKQAGLPLRLSYGEGIKFGGIMEFQNINGGTTNIVILE